MKLILDKGCISCEMSGPGRRPDPEVIYEGFLLWAYREELLENGILRSHLRENPIGQARRLALTSRGRLKRQYLWAERIRDGQMTINGRIVCELDLSESSQVVEQTKVNA